jgi:hypothetical protein
MTTKREWNEFANKMDWEGGMYDVLVYGGPDIFPEEAREAAREFQKAADALHTILDARGAFDPQEIDEDEPDEVEDTSDGEDATTGTLRRKSDRPAGEGRVES